MAKPIGVFKKTFHFFREKAVLILICSVIVGACLAMLFRHYTVGGSKEDLITILEMNILDWRVTTRGVVKPKSKIAILAIDEKSIEKFGRWPFSRSVYGQALRNLKKAEVRWIALDAVFSEKERPTLDDAKHLLVKHFAGKRKIPGSQVKGVISELEVLRDISPADRQFSKAIEAFGNVILGYFYFLSKYEIEQAGRQEAPFRGIEEMESSEIQLVILPEGRTLADYPQLTIHGIVPNISPVTASSPYHAFFSNEADSDAVMRWATLVRIIDGRLMPSLTLKLAAEMLERDILVEFDNIGIQSIELISREDETDVLEIPIDPLGIGRALINHRGPRETFPHISLADAYDNNFDVKTREQLKDAVLLLGMTAIGINDMRPNPFDTTTDGVEVHAAALDNIVNKDLLQRPKSIYVTELLIVLFIGLLFSPLMIASHALVSALLTAASIVGYYFFDHYYWFNNGIWAYMGVPFIEITLLFVSTTLFKYFSEEYEKRKVKGAFSLYLAPEVIDQVLDEPGQLRLGGERKKLTIFFSDVRGFTTISESLTPEQLCEFMNTYFTPMTEIILRSKGVLDKYIGDAIMAFWGAPLSLPDHADRALNSSIDMLYALDKLQREFKEKGFPHCDIGIGLNTGEVSVGNMGSNERFCYTVMGDAVNLASRLEGLTKEYGIRLILSEFTVATLSQTNHLVRDLDDIRVKGKKEPVKVYHCFRPDDLAEKDLKELIGMFGEGRKFYREQDWKKASSIFADCLKIEAKDGPSLVYLKRIEEFTSKPFIENWDGVYTFTHK
ncbi:MAG: adenylate/guanylate cyclase domain-containing protein [Deltaproteobacteria bacterium]|nr:adenylate/guanylate cyclase domain-containing protein [Deltaproteobacteria bacterium]